MLDPKERKRLTDSLMIEINKVGSMISEFKIALTDLTNRFEALDRALRDVQQKAAYEKQHGEAIGNKQAERDENKRVEDEARQEAIPTEEPAEESDSEVEAEEIQSADF